MINKLLSCTLLLVLLLSSCSQSLSEEALIGKWQCVDVSFNIRDLSPAILESSRQIVLSTSYEFKADHQMITIDSDSPEGKKAAWKLKGDILSFYIEPSSGEKTELNDTESKYKVTQFSGDAMQLLYDYGNLGDLTIHVKKK